MKYLVIILISLIIGIFIGKWSFKNTLDERAYNLGLMQCCDDSGNLKYGDSELHYKSGDTMRIKLIMNYLRNGTMRGYNE